MERDLYAISVIWGVGMQYFLGNELMTETEARAMADRQFESLKHNLHKRGALPTVRVWKLVQQDKVERNGNA